MNCSVILLFSTGPHISFFWGGRQRFFWDVQIVLRDQQHSPHHGLGTWWSHLIAGVVDRRTDQHQRPLKLYQWRMHKWSASNSTREENWSESLFQMRFHDVLLLTKVYIFYELSSMSKEALYSYIVRILHFWYNIWFDQRVYNVESDHTQRQLSIGHTAGASQLPCYLLLPNHHFHQTQRTRPRQRNHNFFHQIFPHRQQYPEYSIWNNIFSLQRVCWCDDQIDRGCNPNIWYCSLIACRIQNDIINIQYSCTHH